MLKHAREINSRRFIHDFAWLSIEKIVLEKFWEKITDTCAFFMVVWCQTHYQTLSTRKNWLLCVQNTLLAFCHTGPTKRIEKKSRRIEKARRIKIYTGILFFLSCIIYTCSFSSSLLCFTPLLHSSASLLCFTLPLPSPHQWHNFLNWLYLDSWI